MNIHARYLTVEEVRELASPELEHGFREYGLQSVDVAESKDYQGEPILTISAGTDRPVPADLLVNTLDAIHALLRSKHEERMVFLSTNRPGSSEVIGPSDEEELE